MMWCPCHKLLSHLEGLGWEAVCFDCQLPLSPGATNQPHVVGGPKVMICGPFELLYT